MYVLSNIPIWVQDLGAFLGVLLALFAVVGTVVAFIRSVSKAISKRVSNVLQDEIRERLAIENIKENELTARLDDIHEQVKTPNGIPTAMLVYDAWKRVQLVEEAIDELKVGQGLVRKWGGEHHQDLQGKLVEIFRQITEHEEADREAFEHLGVPSYKKNSQ